LAYPTIEVSTEFKERKLTIRNEAALKLPHFDYKDINMKNFRVQIRYHGYYADYNVECKDTAIDIEKSILDKLGKNEVKLEKDGFTSKRGKWIT